MSWKDILKYVDENYTDKEIEDDLEKLFRSMGKYLNVDSGLYGPKYSIAILFRNAIEDLKNPQIDSDTPYNLKFLNRLIDEASRAMGRAIDRKDKKKEDHYELIENELTTIRRVLEMRMTAGI